MNKSDLNKFTKRKDKLISKLESNLSKKVKASQRKVLKEVIEEFVEKLDVDEEGRIKNTLKNKRQISNIDRVFSKYSRTSGVEIAKEIVNATNNIAALNKSYFSSIVDNNAELTSLNKQAVDFIDLWLGIGERGGVKKNGYLKTIIQDATVRNQVKDIAVKTVIGRKGWQESKSEIQDFIIGNKNKTGAFERYYRNFVYDMFSQVDRTISDVYAEKLDLNFAIYEGGIIKTTREFCRKRNGKVFHRSEIEEFDPETARPPNYNPITDLGGYGCRHHLNWIPNQLAISMRPEAKQFI